MTKSRKFIHYSICTRIISSPSTYVNPLNCASVKVIPYSTNLSSLNCLNASLVSKPNLLRTVPAAVISIRQEVSNSCKKKISNESDRLKGNGRLNDLSKSYK